MKSKSSIYGAVLVLSSIAVGVVYAHFEMLQAALADANSSQAAAAGGGKDAFGCHSHGATKYHCH
jgi:hypothetical protein